MTQQKRRTETEKKIVDAMREQLSEHGFREIGINAIARRAGVSKELIYRYFGSVEAILERMMHEQDFWPSARWLNEISDRDETHGPVANMIFRQGRFLRENDVLREIRNWELVDRNEVTAKLAGERERASLQFLNDHQIDPEDDKTPQIALLLAGMLYLTLRSNTASSFMGVALDSEEGWGRLNDAVSVATEASNNGSVGGALIPALALGIPRSLNTASATTAALEASRLTRRSRPGWADRRSSK